MKLETKNLRPILLLELDLFFLCADPYKNN
jgi:hypothetical protein